MSHRLLLLLALAAPGCAVKSAANHAPPPERATECLEYCDALRMRLAAVVIIRNSAGCVCEPTDAHAAVRGAGVSAGSAVIQVEDEEQQRGSAAAFPNPR